MEQDIVEQQQKDWEQEQEQLDSESAKAIADNEAMIETEHQQELQDKLLLIPPEPHCFHQSFCSVVVDAVNAQLAHAKPIIEKQTRSEERERIFKEAEEMCIHYGSKNNRWVKRCCDECWQALKEEK